MDARIAAFHALVAVMEGEHADRALNEELQKVTDPRERGLATELVYGVLRWQRRLDAELEPRLKKGTDPKLWIILRLGLYQVRFLEKVPERAAVHATVDLAKRNRMGFASGLVNAVLRGILRESVPEIPDGEDVAALSIRWSHPEWLVNGWIEQLGLASTKALLEADQAQAAPTLRIRDGAVDEAIKELTERGFRCERGKWAPHAVRLLEGPPAIGIPEVRENRWVIQDEAAQAVASLLEPAKEHLDLCAAPGGKAFLLADRDLDARLLAVEADPFRSSKLAERVRGMQLEERIRVLNADARNPVPGEGPFPSVLVDAPCSGLGTLRRNPDRKWRPAPDDSLPDLQRAILQQAANQTASGGLLLYVTCTLWRPENEDVAAWFESVHDGWKRVSKEHPFRSEDGFYRSRPDIHGTDGFFAALWRAP